MLSWWFYHYWRTPFATFWERNRKFRFRTLERRFWNARNPNLRANLSSEHSKLTLLPWFPLDSFLVTSSKVATGPPCRKHCPCRADGAVHAFIQRKMVWRCFHDRFVMIGCRRSWLRSLEPTFWIHRHQILAANLTSNHPKPTPLMINIWA